MNKLMVVDDERIIGVQLEERLSLMGFEVVGIASSGVDAVSIAKEYRPDLVLMDIVMPGELDGIQASEIINRELHIPVIFLTAYADDTRIEKAKLIEPQAYIVKPYQESELKAAIEVALYKKKTEQQFHERELGLTEFKESATDAFFLFDSELNCVDVNQTALKMFDLVKNTIMNSNIVEVSPVFAKCNIFPRCKDVLKNGEAYTVENVSIELRHGSMYLSLRAFKAGSFLGITITDVTERQKNEKNMEMAQRIEALNIRIDDIAHNFNNLLSDIMNNIAFAMNRIKNKRRAYKRLIEAEKASMKAKDLVHNLLTFFGEELPEKSISSVKELISNYVYSPESNLNIKCEHNIPQDLWSINVNEEQIGQVITNIIIHSIHSMNGEGIVDISAFNLVINEADILPLDKGNYVKIEITNPGDVITRSDIGRMIDPDMKTVPKDGDLGLTISHSIIKKHNGIITVEYDLDTNTIYSIYLPAVEESTAFKADYDENAIAEQKGLYR